MFAVLKTGGKQYKVTSGDVLKVEKLAADAGQVVQFNDILMITGSKTTVGSPLIKGAAVQAEVLAQIRGEKVINFVKRRRKHGSQRTKGHRQYLTVLRVTEILETDAEKSGVISALNGAGFVSSVLKDQDRSNNKLSKASSSEEPAAVAKKPATVAKKPATVAKKPAAVAKKPAAAAKKPAAVKKPVDDKK